MSKEQRAELKPTILIATASKLYARPLKESLEREGFNVIYSSVSPHHSNNLQTILAEIKTAEPKCLIIHQPNLELEESLRSCTGIVKALKGKVPAFVIDTQQADSNQYRQLKFDGARCFELNTAPNEIVHAIKKAALNKNQVS